jgi:guanylate kinase
MTLESIVSTYKPSPKTVEIVQSTPILLIAGIVGAGKNTVINKLTEDTDKFEPITSHTTRLPRENHGILEQDGIDYHFVKLDDMKKLIEEQKLIEAKYVHGNVYATSSDELKSANKKNKIAVTDIDIQGVVEYLNIKPSTHAIFLLPPSVDTWLKRLERRYGDLEQHKGELRKRLSTARQEIVHILQDKRFIIVINDDLGTTVERITGIISGDITESSDYAEAVTEHLLEYIDSQL